MSPELREQEGRLDRYCGTFRRAGVLKAGSDQKSCDPKLP